MTNDIQQRIVEHYLLRGKEQTFAGKYNCHWLVYYEHFTTRMDAINREKEVKGWRRSKKEALINAFNPEWKFLNFELFSAWPPKEMFHRKDNYAKR